jgi:hypothetical protein
LLLSSELSLSNLDVDAFNKSKEKKQLKELLERTKRSHARNASNMSDGVEMVDIESDEDGDSNIPMTSIQSQLSPKDRKSLDKAIEITTISLNFLRDFPYDELQNNTNLNINLSKCLINCLNHFIKLKHSQYDINRAIRLLQVLGDVIIKKIINILQR